MTTESQTTLSLDDFLSQIASLEVHHISSVDFLPFNLPIDECFTISVQAALSISGILLRSDSFETQIRLVPRLRAEWPTFRWTAFVVHRGSVLATFKKKTLKGALRSALEVHWTPIQCTDDNDEEPPQESGESPRRRPGTLHGPARL